MRIAKYVSELQQDAAFSLRQMLASRGFTAVAGATLALGIGATTAIFSALNAVVLRPLPVPDPDRVMEVYSSWRDQRGNLSAGNFVDMGAEQRVFEAVAAVSVVNMTLSRDAGVERVTGVRASGSFFDVWRVPPALGRVFGPAEDEPGRDQVAVLSHRLWTRQFGSDTGLLGKTIELDGRPHTVIGVMPAEFEFAAGAEGLWVPIAFTPERKAMHDEHFLSVYARLAPGVTMPQASAQLRAIATGLEQRFPKDNADRTLSIAPVLETIVGGYRYALLVLLGAVLFVLLIACGNVSNLLLARGAARARELAVRSALGAGRMRLVRQLFTESAMLSLASAAAGIALAHGLIRLMIAYGPPGVPRLDQTALDGAAVGVAVAVAGLASVVFGLLPAWRASRTDVIGILKEAGRGAGGQGGRDFVRSALIAGEVALALVLLVGAGLLIRSAIEAQATPTGFNPQGVFSARFALPSAKYGSATAVLHASQEIEARVKAIPGVRAATVASTVPGVGTFSNGLVPEGEAAELRNVRQSMARFVSPAYFDVMGLPILRGRGFDDTDRAGAPLVMVVNQTLAQRLWPNQDPIGRRVNGSSPDGAKIVIGVVADVRWRGPAGGIDPEFYQPIAQLNEMAWDWTRRSLFIAARTDADPAALAPGVRRAVASVDPGVPLFAERTMEQRMAATLETARFASTLLGLLGTVGLMLAAVGIYGVISYFAAQRTFEIGIRLALGATRGNVLRLVVRQAAIPVAAGIAIGALGATVAARAIATVLVNIKPHDPLTFAGVAALLAVVALLAAFIPARRAAALDPTRVLNA